MIRNNLKKSIITIQLLLFLRANFIHGITGFLRKFMATPTKYGEIPNITYTLSALFFIGSGEYISFLKQLSGLVGILADGTEPQLKIFFPGGATNEILFRMVEWFWGNCLKALVVDR